MGVTEALREATEFSRTLSSPEAFLVVMAELLADGFEVNSMFSGLTISVFTAWVRGALLSTDPSSLWHVILRHPPRGAVTPPPEGGLLCACKLYVYGMSKVRSYLQCSLIHFENEFNHFEGLRDVGTHLCPDERSQSLIL